MNQAPRRRPAFPQATTPGTACAGASRPRPLELGRRAPGAHAAHSAQIDPGRGRVHRGGGPLARERVGRGVGCRGQLAIPDFCSDLCSDQIASNSNNVPSVPSGLFLDRLRALGTLGCREGCQPPTPACIATWRASRRSGPSHGQGRGEAAGGAGVPQGDPPTQRCDAFSGEIVYGGYNGGEHCLSI
jgi:hypothetical protein